LRQGEKENSTSIDANKVTQSSENWAKIDIVAVCSETLWSQKTALGARLRKSHSQLKSFVVKPLLARPGYLESKRSSAELTVLEAMEEVRLSEPSSALDQVNDQDDNGYHEQEVDESAAKMADEAEKPEHD
jgi:hypothetical protein